MRRAAWDVRRADREVVRSERDRGLQHKAPRHGPIDWRRPGIDYTREDFAQTGRRYDVMLDLVGNRSLSDCRRALTPRGTYVVVGVKDMGRWLGLGRQFKALLLSPFVRQRMRVFVVRHNREDLAVLKELVEAGKIVPVIDRSYAFGDVPEALRYQGEGHARGKIVVTMSRTPPI